MAVVAGRFLGQLLGSAHLVEALCGAKAGKSVTVGHKLVRRFLVKGTALALPIGPMGSAHLRALIPLKPKPTEGLQNRGFAFRRGARLVRVFNAQEELPPLAASKGHVEQGNVGSANVGIPRGARRNAGTDGHGHSWLGEISAAHHSAAPRPRFNLPTPESPAA